MAVAQIKASIDELSPREHCELNALLREWDIDEWDRQMAADAQPGGKLDRLREQAEVEASRAPLGDFPPWRQYARSKRA